MPLAKAGDHVPPVWAVLPNKANRSCDGAVLQMVTAASLPALADGVMLTVTVAESLAQGAMPATVYV